MGSTAAEEQTALSTQKTLRMYKQYIISTHLCLFNDVIKRGKTPPHKLLLLLLKTDFSVSYHGQQSYNLLIMFQAFLADQRGLRRPDK